MHHLLNESWPRLEGVGSPSSPVYVVFFSGHRRSSACDVPLSARRYVAYVSTRRKIAQDTRACRVRLQKEDHNEEGTT